MLAHDAIVAGSVRDRRSRRHGEHEQRAVSAAEGTRRHAHGPWNSPRPHVPRRARGRLRQGQADGRVRRAVRRRIRLHARGAGRVRVALAVARARGEQDGSFKWEIAPVTVSGRKGDVRNRSRRAAGARPIAEQDSRPEAGVSQGRHGDCRELELDFRRRRGAGADAPLARRAKTTHAAGGDRGPCHARAGAGTVHDRARSARCASFTPSSAGRRRTSTCTRSTRHSRS